MMRTATPGRGLRNLEGLPPQVDPLGDRESCKTQSRGPVCRPEYGQGNPREVSLRPQVCPRASPPGCQSYEVIGYRYVQHLVHYVGVGKWPKNGPSKPKSCCSGRRQKHNDGADMPNSRWFWALGAVTNYETDRYSCCGSSCRALVAHIGHGATAPSTAGPRRGGNTTGNIRSDRKQRLDRGRSGTRSRGRFGPNCRRLHHLQSAVRRLRLQPRRVARPFAVWAVVRSAGGGPVLRAGRTARVP